MTIAPVAKAVASGGHRRQVTISSGLRAPAGRVTAPPAPGRFTTPSRNREHLSGTLPSLTSSADMGEPRHGHNLSGLYFAYIFSICRLKPELAPPLPNQIGPQTLGELLVLPMMGVAPPEMRVHQIYRAIVPFVLLQLVGLGLVIRVPDIAMCCRGRSSTDPG